MEDTALGQWVARSVSRGLAVLLFLCLASVRLAAEPAGGTEAPRPGLMWNRTGLPAVFPLQVKTPEGADHYLVLTGEDSGEEALAAYIRGGVFFRVLVPPGRYRLHFASGRGWQGETRLFGAATRHFELPQVLEFALRGPGLKSGHIITLTRDQPEGAWEAAVRDQFICQIAGLDSPEFAVPPSRRMQLGGTADARWSLHLRWRLGLARPEAGTPDMLWLRSQFVLGNPNLRRRPAVQHAPPVRQPDRQFRGYSVRSLYCG
ncbi:hypothetical protein KUW17_09930 [Leisingera aquaemixtae]|uniref:hypothetical protein n=1 Tax=Leisingera aquaemixtae TaxID=1396826 RepID=UPI001C953E70|nr:hypothetical protein [Leisingera aquaemixtae]MBY6067058.1 hypothetical protein [Leisingera aquaemixtae]